MLRQLSLLASNSLRLVPSPQLARATQQITFLSILSRPLAVFARPSELADKLPPLQSWVVDIKTAQPTRILPLARPVFGAPLRVDVLQRVVRWQLAKRQQGTHKAKDRSEVKGSTRKIRQQKGSGMARAGSLRAPQFRHGGRVFPPHPRSHEIKLQKKVRALGLRVALSTKFAQDNLVIIEPFELESHKTKGFAELLELNGLTGKSVLLVTNSEPSENVVRAARNIPRLVLMKQEGLNVYDVLRHEKLVMTADAVQYHIARYENRPSKKTAFQAVPKSAHFPLHHSYPVLGAEDLAHRFNQARIAGKKTATEEARV